MFKKILTKHSQHTRSELETLFHNKLMAMSKIDRAKAMRQENKKNNERYQKYLKA